VAHNTTLNVGSGGDAITDYDIAAAGAYPSSGKVQQVGLYLSTGGSVAPTPYLLGQKTTALSLGVCLPSDQSVSIAGLSDTLPTFYATFDRIVPGNNKYMATLFNTSATRKVVITGIWAFNWQNAAVSGILLEQYLARITARTAGTAVTIRAEDTNDVLSAGISADHNSTVVTEAHIMYRFWHTNAQVTLTSTGLTGGLGSDRSYEEVWTREGVQRGITLRTNEGVTIRNVTNSTVGTCSYLMELLDLAA
jgi:hypothetical protein